MTPGPVTLPFLLSISPGAHPGSGCGPRAPSSLLAGWSAQSSDAACSGPGPRKRRLEPNRLSVPRINCRISSTSGARLNSSKRLRTVGSCPRISCCAAGMHIAAVEPCAQRACRADASTGPWCSSSLHDPPPTRPSQGCRHAERVEKRLRVSCGGLNCMENEVAAPAVPRP